MTDAEDNWDRVIENAAADVAAARNRYNAAEQRLAEAQDARTERVWGVKVGCRVKTPKGEYLVTRVGNIYKYPRTGEWMRPYLDGRKIRKDGTPTNVTHFISSPDWEVVK